jgi:flagellar biogenesis protein FliO
MLVRLVLGTVAVLALCVLTLWVGKRWLRPLAVRDGAGKELRVIEALPLSGRCSVYLIQAGKCRALAGVDATGLKALLTLTEPFEEGLAEGKAEEAPAEAEVALPKAA